MWNKQKNLLAWWTLRHESQLQDEAGAELSESELLLDDDASLELSDANTVGLVKSTDLATLASSGRSTYIQQSLTTFLGYKFGCFFLILSYYLLQQHYSWMLTNTKQCSLLNSRKQTCRVRNHLWESFGRPRTVLCHTAGKLVMLQKFCVTPIVLSRLMTTCHQPPGTNTVSPGCWSISIYNHNMTILIVISAKWTEWTGEIYCDALIIFHLSPPSPLSI